MDREVRAASLSARAAWSSSSCAPSRPRTRFSAASNAPASYITSAAASVRLARLSAAGVSIAARSRNAPAAARPPRAFARAAVRSSSAAMSSSGVDVDCARCHALRSRSRFGSVASASAPCASRRSRGVAVEYTAERRSGWRNEHLSRIWNRPATSAGSADSMPRPRLDAARTSRSGSPSGSAAARTSRRRVSAGSDFSWRLKLLRSAR